MKVKQIQERDCLKLVYSQCWEDPHTIREALRVTPDDDILMVTSVGCEAIL